MFEKCLNEAEFILSSQKEPLVPVRVVWEELVRRSKPKGIEIVSLSDFTALLEGDQRFQLLPAEKEEEDDLADVENSDDPEMEQMGFFPEDRVRLRSSSIEEIEEPTEEEEEISSMHVRGLVSGSTKTKIAPHKKIKPVVKKKVDAKKAAPKKSKPAKKKPAAKRAVPKKRKK